MAGNTLMTLLVSLGLDSGKFQKGIGDAEKQVLSFSQKMTGVGQSMQRIGGMMTLGLTLPIVAFGAASVKSAMESEAAIADLEAVIKSTGGTAGVTSKEVQDLANNMQKLTKFSDEEVISGSAMLLTFTNIGKDVFPDATQATADMAQKFGMDMPQAAITLGKALNDPIAGVTALRRIGVQLTDQQEAQIESFIAVGDIASAQKIILGELTTEIGGVAEAFGKTSGGQMAIFMNKLDNMKEVIGAALIPSLIRFMDAITPMIVAFTNAPPAIQNTVIGLLALLAAAGPLISVLGTLMTVIGAFSTGGALAGVGAAAAAAGAGILAALLPLLPVLALIAAAVALVWLVWKNWDALGTTISQFWFFIKMMLSEVANTAKQLGFLIGLYLYNKIVAVGAVFLKIGNVIMSVFSAIGRAIDWVGVKLNAFAQKLISLRLPSWLKPGSPTPMEIGLLGIADGFTTANKAAMPFLKTMADLGKAISTPQAIPMGAGGNIFKNMGKKMPIPVGAGGNIFENMGKKTPIQVGAGENIFKNMGEKTPIPTGNNGLQPMNIYITNPKKETSEESIKKTMKSLSYMGVIPA